MDQEFQKLKESAKAVCKEIFLREDCNAGTVGAAIETSSGQIFTGICLHLCCGIGTCAEHAAVLEMLKSGETRIDRLVAVNEQGEVMAPCGRCRELLVQVDGENLATKIQLSEKLVVALGDLLPYHWLEG